MVSVLLALLAPTGCSEQKVTVNHEPPEVSLVAPVDGATYLVGEAVSFEAVIRDEDDLDTLLFSWSSSAQGPVEGALTLIAEQELIWYTAEDLVAGEHTVLLQVTDRDAEQGSDSVRIIVNDPLDLDLDEDGYAADEDCDDEDPDVNPGAEEIWYDGVDQDCDGLSDFDQDGDGYPLDEDCDDDALTGPEVHPDAEEVCDDIDNDCDGTIDGPDATDATEWYLDADSDGFGAAESAWECEIPAGYTHQQGDCADDDAAVNPDQPEVVYNGLDDDCDEATPDDDLDADGFVLVEDCDDADPEVRPDAAEIPYNGLDDDCDEATPDDDLDADGFVLAEDCDDTDGEVNPDALEVCDDVDNDCDGTVDGPGAADAPSWYVDADSDSFGTAESTRDCEVPAGYAAQQGDCDDGAPEINPDAEEICDDGVDQDCDGVAEDCLIRGAVSLGGADAAFLGETNNDSVGWHLMGVGDTTGDGCGDLLIGAPDAGSPGTAYLVAGCPLIGEASLGDSEAVLLGASNNDQLGGAIAGADLDGDDVSDLIIGAVGAADDLGAAWVFSGPVSGELTSDDASASVTAAGGAEHDLLGFAVATGDVDGDGTPDLIVTAPGADPYETREDAGAVYVFLNPGVGDLDVADADYTLVGAEEADGYGAAVVTADFDGDGLMDVVAGAPEDDGAGRNAGVVTVFLATAMTGLHNSTQADVLWQGERNDGVGVELAAGDLDGDGDDELVLGVPSLDEPGDDAGAAFVLEGGAAGGYTLADAAATLRGATGDLLGESVSVGDVDGDGIRDLLVGARGAFGDTSYAYGGEAALFYGMPSGELVLSDGDWLVLGDTNYARLGGGVAITGDLTGDGPGELVLGAPHWSGGSLAGAVFVFEGGGL